jgi:hypothetical protein
MYYRSKPTMWDADKFAEKLRVSIIEGSRWPTKPEITEIVQNNDLEQLWFEDGSSVIINNDGTYDVLEGIVEEELF